MTMTDDPSDFPEPTKIPGFPAPKLAAKGFGDLDEEEEDDEDEGTGDWVNVERTTQPKDFVYLGGEGLKRRPNLSTYDLIVLNTSAGKDSQVMMAVAVKQARAAGVFDRCIAVHCDLGPRIEWAGTRELAEKQAKHYGLPFYVVEKDVDILDNTWKKYQSALAHGKVHPPWPSQAMRWCTSEHKTAQVSSLVTKFKTKFKLGRPMRVLNVMGIRSQESSNRARCPMCKNVEHRAALKGAASKMKGWLPKSECWACGGTGKRSQLRTTWKGYKTKVRQEDEWLPILDWTLDEVWESIAASGVPHHPAYDIGMPRLSCAFCFYAPKAVMVLAGHYNRKNLDAYVELERRLLKPDGSVYTYLQGFSIESIRDLVDKTPLEKARADAAKYSNVDCGD